MSIQHFTLLVLMGLGFGDGTTRSNEFGVKLADMLGLEKNDQARPKRQLSLTNSASKFLLEIYDDLNGKNDDLSHVRKYVAHGARQKRELEDGHFITKFDRKKIENCTNIITFSSKKITNQTKNINKDMQIGFNTNGVPNDLQLVHSALRIYQDPSYGKHSEIQRATASVSLYESVMNGKEYSPDLNILTSVNTTVDYNGWLEFNMTSVMSRWLQQKPNKTDHIKVLTVGVTFRGDDNGCQMKAVQILASDLGLINRNLSKKTLNLQPFLIGYFISPQWTNKFRVKRDLAGSQLNANSYIPPITCKLLNFTVNFEDLHMIDLIVAPLKFDAFFCGGECNFPLASSMNATNHAIVQTLVQLKKSYLSKPSCVPTVLDSLLILHYVNDDNLNLHKYPNTVAKACGCH